MLTDYPAPELTDAEYRLVLQSFVSGAGLKVEGDETTDELEEAIANVVTSRARR